MGFTVPREWFLVCGREGVPDAGGGGRGVPFLGRRGSKFLWRGGKGGSWCSWCLGSWSLGCSREGGGRRGVPGLQGKREVPSPPGSLWVFSVSPVLPRCSWGPRVCVDVNIFFLCRPYVTVYSRHWTRTHKNCDNSFSTNRSGRYDDNKDSLNEIPFLSQRTQMTAHECKPLSLSPSFTQITFNNEHQCCQVITERKKTFVVTHLCIPPFSGCWCVRIQSRLTSCWSFSILLRRVGKKLVGSLFFIQGGLRHMSVQNPSSVSRNEHFPIHLTISTCPLLARVNLQNLPRNTLNAPLMK